MKVKELLSRKDDLYIFEGEKLVSDLLSKKFIPHLLVLDIDQVETFATIIPANIPVWYVSDKVIRKISSLKSPPSIIAVYENLPESHGLYNENIVIAMDGIQDPGNLGTVFRCAAAFGIRSIALSGESVKLTNTKFLRSAQNSVFYTSVKKYSSLEDLISEAIEKKFNIYLTSSHRQGHTSSVKNISLPAVIVVGNEGIGLDKKLLNKYSSISIRQTEVVESLNAGISGCLLMNQMAEHFGLIKS